MIHKNRVEEIFKQTAVLMEGHFILTSGRHSKRYMQCAKILQYPAYAEELAACLAEPYREVGVDVVIGPAIGGVILAYETARQLDAKNLFAERVNGQMTLRRGFSLDKDARVLVVEDIVSTGGTVQEMIDLVTALGGCVVGVGVLVDRSMGVAHFDVPYHAVYTVAYDTPEDAMTWSPDECPLCKEGRLPAVKPGSHILRG